MKEILRPSRLYTWLLSANLRSKDPLRLHLKKNGDIESPLEAYNKFPHPDLVIKDTEREPDGHRWVWDTKNTSYPSWQITPDEIKELEVGIKNLNRKGGPFDTIRNLLTISRTDSVVGSDRPLKAPAMSLNRYMKTLIFLSGQYKEGGINFSWHDKTDMMYPAHARMVTIFQTLERAIKTDTPEKVDIELLSQAPLTLMFAYKPLEWLRLLSIPEDNLLSLIFEKLDTYNKPYIVDAIHAFIIKYGKQEHENKHLMLPALLERVSRKHKTVKGESLSSLQLVELAIEEIEEIRIQEVVRNFQAVAEPIIGTGYELFKQCEKNDLDTILEQYIAHLEERFQSSVLTLIERKLEAIIATPQIYELALSFLKDVQTEHILIYSGQNSKEMIEDLRATFTSRFCQRIKDIVDVNQIVKTGEDAIVPGWQEIITDEQKSPYGVIKINVNRGIIGDIKPFDLELFQRDLASIWNELLKKYPGQKDIFVLSLNSIAEFIFDEARKMPFPATFDPSGRLQTEYLGLVHNGIIKQGYWNSILQEGLRHFWLKGILIPGNKRLNEVTEEEVQHAISRNDSHLPNQTLRACEAYKTKVINAFTIDMQNSWIDILRRAYDRQTKKLNLNSL